MDVNVENMENVKEVENMEDDEYNFIMMRTVNMIMVETIIMNMKIIMSNKAEGCSEDGDDDGRAARIQATM